MKYLIGIDEVGRGPLAGPVVVAAVAIPSQFRVSRFSLRVLRDSKKLSEKQREAWFEYFRTESRILYAIARVYPKTIDRINISEAANRAAFFAYQRLVRDNPKLHVSREILLDGGLYLKNREESFQTYNAKTIIKGDEKHLPIMIASIIAKVTRDRYMDRLAKCYSGYGFEDHKGYGTKAHYRALRKLGPSPAHRRSFLGALRG